ncbi:MAG: acyltransferase family protein [Miltoncostaeaceae bacterium]
MTSTDVPRRPGRIPFRGDIEGLRGVGTIWVLAYHAGVPLTTGGYVGLDIFFVMSGFLITALLVHEAEKDGRIDIPRFFARRIRRLLPSTVAVLAFIMAAAWAIMTPLQREGVAQDVVAAALYVVNWRFVDQQTDYLSAGLDASPGQHFWSLSVEEQFYAVWPFVAVAALWLALRKGWPFRLVAGLGVGAIGLALFIYALDHTREAAGAAYFSTLSRGWAFAIGCGIALIPVAWVRMPRWGASLAVVGGMAALLWCTVTFDETTLFPAPMGLIPVLATAAIILAGVAHADSLAARALNFRPARFIGRISYSWYLWHWPLLVFAAVLWGDLSWQVNVVVVAVSFLPTMVAHHLVEERFRYPRTDAARRPRRAFAIAAGCTAAISAIGVVAYLSTPSVPTASASEAVGARVLLNGGESSLQENAAAVRPNPKTAIRDRGQADHDGCLIEQDDLRSPACVYGDPRGRATMVLFGDSFAMQYFPALNRIAKARNWRFVVLTKSGCTPADVAMYNSQFRRRYTECERWRRHTLVRIARERPSLVIVGNSDLHLTMQDGERLDREPAARALQAGLVRTLRTLRRTRAQVAVIRGNPRSGKDVRGCVSSSLRNLERCAFSKSRGYQHRQVNVRAARAVRGARLIDPSGVLCPGRLCPAVIGNVLVYRNSDHITATYIDTLTPWFAKRLPRRLPAR